MLSNNLLEMLSNKSCFKLVCGAGNEDVKEVEKLVALYSAAGCKFFDLCAKSEIIDAAKSGLVYSTPKNRHQEFNFCVSVGIQGDPHVSKAVIDETKCIGCKKCIGQCLQHAISATYKKCTIKITKCIGCGKCSIVCPASAVSFVSEKKDLKEVLPLLIDKGIDCIELHALEENDVEVDEKWKDINDLYSGILSICIDRSKLSNEKLIARIKKLLSIRMPYTTIIQADGVPMSGGKDDFKTTLQTVATAEIVQDEAFPVFILLSGGTNSKTTELAKQCDVCANGVAIGSFARKIVKEELDRDDFLVNKEIFNKALEKAKELVDISLKYLGDTR
jgi:Fe-S-cluster-containing hydrogenase component 2